MPKDKQYIANILKLTISMLQQRDGTNDIPMLNTSTGSVGVNKFK